MIERLSWYARDHDTTVNITFGERKQIKFTNLETYIMRTLRNSRYPNAHFIDYESLGKLRDGATSSNVLLQAADWVASGIAQGLNEDRHGNLEDRYAELIRSTLWVQNGVFWQRGFTVIPSNMDRKQFELLRKMDTWLEVPAAPVLQSGCRLASGF